jgi:hypothetical protein
MKNKVSFDYDGCLEMDEVQDFVRDCQAIDCEIWIVTSRYSARKKGNDDLYQVADSLDIPHDRVVFTERNPKKDFFEDHSDFTFHLDDDYDEVLGIDTLGTVKSVWYRSDESWQKDCLDAIDISDFFAL